MNQSENVGYFLPKSPCAGVHYKSTKELFQDLKNGQTSEGTLFFEIKEDMFGSRNIKHDDHCTVGQYLSLTDFSNRCFFWSCQ